MIKASDIRSMFGHISQGHPLFRRRENDPHELVQGTNSAKLKFAERLCAHCNNTRTQPHDRSWEALSTFLRQRQPPIRAGMVVRLTGIFRGGLRKQMHGVHLYFIKLFGCLIADNDIPLDIRSFSEAILNETPHPHIYLSFLAVSHRRIRQHAAITPVHADVVNSRVLAAHWFYFVGPLAVEITYAVAIRGSSKEVHLWHPSHSAKHIVIDRLGKAAAAA